LDTKILNHLYAQYFAGNIQKGKNLVHSFAGRCLSWDEFVKKPARAELLGHTCLGKMGLWLHRIDLEKVKKIALCKERQCKEIYATFT
jgi:hypothetical protein